MGTGKAAPWGAGIMGILSARVHSTSDSLRGEWIKARTVHADSWKFVHGDVERFFLVQASFIISHSWRHLTELSGFWQSEQQNRFMESDFAMVTGKGWHYSGKLIIDRGFFSLWKFDFCKFRKIFLNNKMVNTWPLNL